MVIQTDIIYISLKTSSNEENTELHVAIGQFMEQWILLESLINSISMNKNPNYRTPFSTNNLKLIFFIRRILSHYRIIKT